MITKIPIMTIAVTVLVIVLFVIAPFGSDLFQALLASKHLGLHWYTPITTQFIHTDLNHLVFDAFAFAVLSYCIEIKCIETKTWQYWLISLSSCFGVIGVWFLIQSQFNQYAGLSGALNGLFVVALYCLLDVDKLRVQKTAWNGFLFLLLIGAVVKNSYELYTDVALFSDTRWRSTPSFHTVGMVVGCVLVAVFYLFERRKKPTR